MKRMLVLVMIIVGMSLMLITHNTIAALTTHSVEGTVVEVFADHMIINQQLVLHVNQKVDLKIDANTKLEQASSLIAFKAGDEVEVEYYEVEGAKIAIFIKKVAEVKDSGPEKV